MLSHHEGHLIFRQFLWSISADRQVVKVTGYSFSLLLDDRHTIDNIDLNLMYVNILNISRIAIYTT